MPISLCSSSHSRLRAVAIWLEAGCSTHGWGVLAGTYMCLEGEVIELDEGAEQGETAANPLSNQKALGVNALA